MLHYNNTLGLNGDIGVILDQLNPLLEKNKSNVKNNRKKMAK